MLEKMTARRKNRGSALAELCVAMALLAIVSTMIVSFSAVVNRFVESEQSQYAFLEEATVIRDSLSVWLSETDEAGTVYTVTSGELSVDSIGTSALFDDRTQCLILTDRDGILRRIETQTVDRVLFTIKPLSGENAIVKCTVIGSHELSQLYTQSFILSLRCASFAG